MKILKPIRDYDSYSDPIARAIFDMLDKEIFHPLYMILQLPVTKQNALAHGHPNLTFQGFKIHIEKPAGSIREGKKWTQKMAHAYGYICGTQAIDGDELDCFVGTDRLSTKVFIIEQMKENGEFDEYKLMFGFNELNEAKEGYLDNYQSGWTGMGYVHERDIFNFWDWYNARHPKDVLNAIGTPLTEAIRTGDIQYVDGYFYGPLRAVLSKELRGYGAVYNKIKKAYKLEISRIPQNVLQAIADSKQQNADQIKKVNDFLDAQSQKNMPPPEVGAMMDEILEKLRKQFESTTKAIDASVIEIPFDQKFADQIKDAYTTNLEKYIQLWHDEQILRLREKVSQNVQAGYRAEKLIDTIMGERKVSFHKAMFLAKQETSLMTAKYREVRYADIGVNEYMWSTSQDSRVRHDHRELQGKIFRFDHPPVTNRHTMARNNPGEDFSCRCVAIPVLSTVNMLEREYATQ